MTVEEQVQQNLELSVAPLLAKYRSFIKYLRPGQYHDIYPWHDPTGLVMEVAIRLRKEGWCVRRRRVRRYSDCGYNWVLRVTAPDRRPATPLNRLRNAIEHMLGLPHCKTL